MIEAGETRSEIYMGNTIEYDVKSSQIKVLIVKRTKIRVKGLTVNRSQKNCWYGQRVCGAIKQTYIKSNQ